MARLIPLWSNNIFCMYPVLLNLLRNVCMRQHMIYFSECVFFFFFFLAVLGLRCCTQAFSSCGEQGLLFLVMRRLLIAVASLVAEHGLLACRLQQLWNMGSVVVAHGLQSAGSVVVAHGLSCSTACGIFLDQSLNPCPLHWQVDSQPLSHQGSPSLLFLNTYFLL